MIDAPIALLRALLVRTCRESPFLVTRGLRGSSVPANQVTIIGRALNDRELWSAATIVLRQHGDLAPVFVAERIGELALAGDADGVQTWKQIAARLDMLASGTSQ